MSTTVTGAFDRAARGAQLGRLNPQPLSPVGDGFPEHCP